MKKIFFFATMILIVLQGFTNPNPSLKSGVLQKDHYGAFTGNQWEEFFLGLNADVFNAKANITLSEYKAQVESYVQSRFKKTLPQMMDESEVYDFPDGVTVRTARLNGEFINRAKYGGEKGYYHTPTGTYWLSFKCGNICDFTAGAIPVTPNPPAVTPPSNPTTPGGNVNSNTVTVLPPAPQLQGQSLTEAMANYDLIHAKVRQGVSEANADALVQQALAKSSGCCDQQQGGNGNMYLQAGYALQPQPSVQYVQTERYPTFMGAVLRETLGTAGGIGLAWGVSQLFMPRGGGGGFVNPNIPWNPIGAGGPVQGGTQNFGGPIPGGTLGGPTQGATGFNWLSQ